MEFLLIKLLYSITAFASEEGGSHSHGAGRESEHLFPVLMVFAVLVIGGLVFHFMTKKK